MSFEEEFGMSNGRKSFGYFRIYVHAWYDGDSGSAELLDREVFCPSIEAEPVEDVEKNKNIQRCRDNDICEWDTDTLLDLCGCIEAEPVEDVEKNKNIQRCCDNDILGEEICEWDTDTLLDLCGCKERWEDEATDKYFEITGSLWVEFYQSGYEVPEWDTDTSIDDVLTSEVSERSLIEMDILQSEERQKEIMEQLEKEEHDDILA